MRTIAIILLLATVASAATISDFPSMYAKSGNFSAIYVIGDESPALDVVSATVISTSLARHNLTTLVGTSRLDTEVGDITLHDAVVIGSPCENRAAAQLENNPNPCNANLGGSAGYLKLFEHNGKRQLLITGLTAEDRHQAARFLARENLASLKVSTFIIPTNTHSKPQYFAKPNLTNTTTATVKDIQSTVNETMLTPKPTVNVTQNKTKSKPHVGEYEPLERLPQKKSVFERFWNWMKGIFT